MTLFLRTLFALCALAIASPASAGQTDAAYELVGGVWSCKTFGHTALTHEFRRTEDAQSLVNTTVAQIDGRSGTLIEKYTFAKSRNVWVASLRDGKYVAEATPFMTPQWMFTGHEAIEGIDVMRRMIFSGLTAKSFERVFQRSDGGVWKTYAGENCAR